MKLNTDKRRYMYYATLIGVLFLIMLPLIFSNNVWGDEAHTMVVSQYGWSELYQNHLTGDCHPVLYLFFIKLYTMVFGATIPAVKLITILPIILTMVLGATKIDRYFGKGKVALPTLFIIAVAAAPNFLFISVELRVYSWAMFFVTYCGLLAYELINVGITRKRLAMFIVISLLAAYCHYFALVSAAVIYGILFVAWIIQDKKYWKYCIGISVVTILGYLPGVVVFIKQATRVNESGFWIDEITTNTMWEYVLEPFGGETGLYLMIFLFVLLLNGISILENKDRKDAILSFAFMSVYFGTVLVGIIVSNVMTPVFVIRYAYPGLGLLWLGVLIGLQNTKILQHRLCVVALISMFLTYGFGNYMVEYDAAKDDGATTVVSYIEENADDDAVLVSDVRHINWILLEFYFPDYERVKIENFSLADIDSEKDVYYISSSGGSPYTSEEQEELGRRVELVLSSNMDLYNVYVFRIYSVVE